MSACGTDPVRVLAITVLYNSETALNNWYRLKPSHGVRVLAVDNASTDQSAEVAQKRGVELVRSDTNIGFGRACNLGAENAQGEEWFAFVNPDVAVTAEQLLDIASRVPEGVVATSPVLTDTTGAPQGDVFRQRPTVRFITTVWLLGGMLAKALHGRRIASPASDHRQVTEVTSGACLLVRVSAFKEVGGFPPWLFFNLEDVVLCEELGRLGKIDVDLSVHVPHQKLSSGDATPHVDLLAETARATSAYVAKTRGLLTWALVLASVTVGMAIRSRKIPGRIALLADLVRVCLSEGRELRRGTSSVAGPIFVGNRP